MTKSKLYTGTGDLGTTSLVGGERIKKNCCRLEAYGTIDEFSSFLGCVLSDPSCPPQHRDNLLEVQKSLFCIGSYLACSMESGTPLIPLDICDKDIENIERLTDELDASTPPSKSFVLPGGTPLSAATHVARTVCRRAERRILELADAEPVDPRLLRYMNRLSDYLFILARHFNHLAGVPDIPWLPRK